MKKIAIASLIALAAVSASALEVGVTAAREYTGTNTNGTGITLGQKFGKVGVSFFSCTVAYIVRYYYNRYKICEPLNGTYNLSTEVHTLS